MVGPDGTRIAIDVGNDSHDDDLRDELNAMVAPMQAAGFTVSDARLDHVVLTHLHADHADGLGDLLAGTPLSGRIVHRGLVDLTAAAGDASIGKLCAVLAAHPTADLPLCAGPALTSCDPAAWSDTRPSTGCTGLHLGDLLTAQDDAQALGSYLPLGSARLRMLAVDGSLGDARIQETVGPLRTDDLNGENARSLVGVLEQGPFRMLVSGDLTGASPDSDDVEGFYAELLAADPDLSPLGGDVYHAGHHGRDSSSTAPWVDLWLPADGRDRSAWIGVSQAHVGSPYASVLERLEADDRLHAGRVWTTRVATGGASTPSLLSAEGGHLVLRTEDGGAAYVVQAIAPNGAVLSSWRYDSVRSCGG